MSSQIYDEVEATADKLKNVEGVLAVILFGSYAREDFHEGSDIDLLVLFKDKKFLEEKTEEVSGITSKTDLFFQVVCLTVEEFKKSTLLPTVLSEGKVYHTKLNLKNLLIPWLKPYALVTYSTSNLKPRARVVLSQHLEGRGKGRYKYGGMIQNFGGYKVGRGVIMIPVANLKPLLSYLENMGAQYVIRYVWA